MLGKSKVRLLCGTVQGIQDATTGERLRSRAYPNYESGSFLLGLHEQHIRRGEPRR